MAEDERQGQGKASYPPFMCLWSQTPLNITETMVGMWKDCPVQSQE